MTSSSSHTAGRRKQSLKTPSSLTQIADTDLLQEVARRYFAGCSGIGPAPQADDAADPSSRKAALLVARRQPCDGGNPAAAEMSGLASKLILDTLLNAELDCQMGYRRYVHTGMRKSRSGSGREAAEAGTGADMAGGGIADTGSPRARSTKNYRNGTYLRRLRVREGLSVMLSYPRDRTGKFESVFVPSTRLDLSGSGDRLLQLVSGTCTVSDIAALFGDLFRVQVPHDYIGPVMEHFSAHIDTWRQRRLDAFYPFVFMDFLPVPCPPSQAGTQLFLPAVLGIDTKGEKELLAIDRPADGRERDQGYEAVLERLRTRGLQETLFVCVPADSKAQEGEGLA